MSFPENADPRAVPRSGHGRTLPELSCKRSGGLHRKKFAGLTKNDKDARQLALEFYGPIFLLYSLYDGTDEKQDVTKMVEQHVERFSKRLEDTEESSKRD